MGSGENEEKSSANTSLPAMVRACARPQRVASTLSGNAFASLRHFHSTERGLHPLSGLCLRYASARHPTKDLQNSKNFLRFAQNFWNFANPRSVVPHCKKPSHKQHIWFLPTQKPTLKTKRAVFCQRLIERICKFAF
ncbi:hypothetical protein SAMN04488541_10582 [Thermoflexibacter ruber]|uniref:Uncharacterized protein n=1 Tax=Thermoflexibacter ruber TaxID=1003 RepID=A0A1I2JQ48_9BACT|nr:hypothetical protein SAMN04488541_10582 [Thermoflexibacter ruber]